MYNFDLLSYDNIPEDGKEGEHRWKCGLSIDDKEGDMVHFQPVGKVSNPCPAFIGMRDDYDLVASINELCRQLVYVAFDSSWLWKEEVADHGDVVAHVVGLLPVVGRE